MRPVEWAARPAMTVAELVAHTEQFQLQSGPTADEC